MASQILVSLIRRKPRRSALSVKRSQKRFLSIQALETRQLLAATIAPVHSTDLNDGVAAEVGQMSVAHSTSHGLTITDAFVATHHDKVPRFANLGDSLVNTRSGHWSDPNIWPDGKVPGADARVIISPTTTVIYDLQSDVRYDAIEIQGSLNFATDINTRMIVDVLMVMPEGNLTIGTADAPVSEDVVSEIIFRGDTALKTGTLENPGIDPGQYGKGLIAFGTVTFHGAAKDPTFVRLGEDAKAGDTVLNVDQLPVGWRVGDRLVVPDTRQIALTQSNPSFTSQAEEVVITAINGRQLSISKPLSYDHAGPRDAQGNVGAVEQSMLPHIANLTRNVVLRSETPDNLMRRGHTMFLHRADLDLQNAAFEGLGRTTTAIRSGIDSTRYDEHGNPTHIGTNQVGRYSIHLHRVWGAENPENTGYQGKIVGSVIEDFVKWGVAVHDTHYFLIQSNIAYAGRGNSLGQYNGVASAAFATEEGNESYNEFDGNFVIHTKAGDSQRILGSPGVSIGGLFNKNETARDGFWFRGQHNYVTNNVVANAPDFAYNYNGHYVTGLLKVPKFRGADMMDPEQYDVWNPNANRDANGKIIGVQEGLPVLKSSGNEAYGATGQGLWISRPQGDIDRVNFYSSQISLHENFRIWHVSDAGVNHWGQDNRTHFSGFVLRNDPAVSAQNSGAYNKGFTFGNSYYATGQLVVRDFDVQGFNIGLQLPHRPYDYDASTNDVSIFENGSLVNHVNIEDRYARWGTKETIVRNVAFELAAAPAGSSIPEEALNIWMHPDASDHHTYETSLSRLLIFDFNQEPGNNFEVFFEDQAPDAIVQPYRVKRGLPDPNAPGVGLTVQAAWDQFGIAPAGAVAPSQQYDGDNGRAAQARAADLNIKGLLFAFEGEPPKAPQPPPPPGSKIVGLKMPEIVGWSLDEGSGSTVYDYSGNEHHGEIQGAVGWAEGKQGSALEFNGQDGVVNAGNIGHSDQLTVSAWVKRGTGGGGTVVTKSEMGWEWELQYGSNGYSYFVINGVNTGVYLGPGTGEWTHLVGTYDKTAIKLYQNGVLVSSKAYTEDIVDRGNSVGIGRRVNGTGASFGGLIDDVRILSRALSATEIASLATAPPVDSFNSAPSIQSPSRQGIAADFAPVLALLQQTETSIDLSPTATSNDVSRQSNFDAHDQVLENGLTNFLQWDVDLTTIELEEQDSDELSILEGATDEVFASLGVDELKGVK